MSPSTAEAKKRLPRSAPYTSRIIKAGALIGDTKTLLSQWDVDAPVQENIQRVQRDNVFGKASRSRVEDILAIFRQRYLTEKAVTKALVTLVREKFPSPSLERLFYFHTARADRLLYDTVTEILLPLRESGLTEINVGHLQRPLTRWVAEFVAATRYTDLPPELVELGRKSILDGIGLALVGSAAKSGAITRSYLESLSLGRGAATVIGSAIRCAPRFAAFANGVGIAIAEAQLAAL